MEKKIEFTPAFDKRNADPKIDYGIHGMEIRWLLIGKHGAVQFLLYTNWQLPHVVKEWGGIVPRGLMQPLPADLGYHSHKSMYDGQEPMPSCPYIEGECYYDGSGLSAQRIYDTLVTHGGDAVWKELEDYYKETFGELA